jgi:hypothetical protein
LEESRSTVLGRLKGDPPRLSKGGERERPPSQEGDRFAAAAEWLLEHALGSGELPIGSAREHTGGTRNAERLIP